MRNSAHVGLDVAPDAEAVPSAPEVTAPARLYPLDESDRIVADRVVLSLAADWRPLNDRSPVDRAAAPMNFGPAEAAACRS